MTTIDAGLRDTLIARARSLAAERHWHWEDPVEVTAEAHNGRPVWAVCSNVGAFGASVRVLFSREDQAIVHAGYLPR